MILAAVDFRSWAGSKGSEIPIWRGTTEKFNVFVLKLHVMQQFDAFLNVL